MPRWRSDLPVTFLMTIGLQAFTALVVVHLETTLLFEVTHGVKLNELKKKARQRAERFQTCKALLLALRPGLFDLGPFTQGGGVDQ